MRSVYMGFAALAILAAVAAAGVGYKIGHSRGYAAGRESLGNEIKAELRATGDKLRRQFESKPATRPAR